MAISANGAPGVTTDIVYEQCFGVKNELEVDMPLTFQNQNRAWYGGVGDTSIGWKRVLFSACKGEVRFPLGNKTGGLEAVYEGARQCGGNRGASTPTTIP